MENITISEIKEFEKTLRFNGYIKEIFKNGEKFCWRKDFGEFVISVCCSESRDENNNRRITIKFKGVLVNGTTITIKGKKIDLKSFEEMCQETNLLTMYGNK